MPGAVMVLFAASEVKAPDERVVAPIEVLLMAPPPIATESVRRVPVLEMMARTVLLVTNRRSILLVVPMNLPVGASARSSSLAAMLLPISVQA